MVNKTSIKGNGLAPTTTVRVQSLIGENIFTVKDNNAVFYRGVFIGYYNESTNIKTKNNDKSRKK